MSLWDKRPWRSREERDEAARNLGRMQAQARGLRQAAARDGAARDSTWQPGRVPAPRQARSAERTARQKARKLESGLDPGRAAALKRASGQSLARTARERQEGRSPR